ncbi:hypothetical protein EG329_002604 [Mollisiaceae sp. DMI_Dod_QoI]|nr:hypothetical protein EG329_002604 [Helotiales sp. DMI_Dod_QoI]
MASPQSTPISKPDNPPSETKKEAAPIVFSAQGQPQPDTRLTVFDRQFHVHSMVLKLHSGYFNAFFEPKNEEPAPEPAPGQFKYEYITKIDNDGTWFPGRAADTKDPAGDVKNYIGDPRAQETAFEKLLHIFYDRPIRIKDVFELSVMTEKAQYLLAIPKFSLAFHSALHYDGVLLQQLRQMPEEFLPIAQKLRSELLFREAFVLCQGPFHAPKLFNIADPNLRFLAWMKHTMLVDQVLHAQSVIVKHQKASNGYMKYSLNLMQTRPDGNVSWPQLMRRLWAQPYYSRNSNQFHALNDAILPLLENNLVLDRSGVGAGFGRYLEYFLSVELLDDELPWDTEEEQGRVVM